MTIAASHYLRTTCSGPQELKHQSAVTNQRPQDTSTASDFVQRLRTATLVGLNRLAWHSLLPRAEVLLSLFLAAFLAAAGSTGFGQDHAGPIHPPNLYDPVADSKAEVIAGHARFTILTPQLIRMEWSADATFEDHASLVFLNRKLSVPQFTVGRNVDGVARPMAVD